MKPHIYLKHAWWDCGWKYEQWCCMTHKHFKLLSYKEILRIGIGGTPAAAYADWKRQFQ